VFHSERSGAVPEASKQHDNEWKSDARRRGLRTR
jgi:hypothetical protein